MSTQWIGVLATFGITLLLAIPLGKYLAGVFKNSPLAKSGPLDIFLPIERIIYRIGGINPTREMGWKENLVALLTINAVWLVYAFLLLVNQGSLPLNPDG
ncbi:potassium-transporting ATPase subunit KdpA, partial [Arsenicibacter rosenii]|uniref:potassium-transporting ATPase subunit KdpA n=1 Tax=Arsenicibacter rosenii TaxID=1750698 RepID=UPI000A9E2A15